MATSYSTNLALALPVTGELSGTWGTVVNSNITNMLDEALGYQAYTATGGADTITIPDGTTGVARSIYIQLNGTGGGSVAVPTAKTKMYFVFNNTASAITFKVTGQTGVSIPAAAKIALVSNGTDIITAENYFAALTLGAALPVASGGTGTTSTTFVNLATNVTGTLPIANGGTGTTSTTFANLTTNVTGTLPVANGGTSLTTLTANNVILGNGTSAPTFVAPSTTGNVLTSNGTTWQSTAPVAQVYPGAGIANSTGSAWGTSYTTSGTGTVVALATSPTFVTPLLGTPTSGNLANCTFPTLNQNTSGSAATFTSTSQNSQFNSVGVGTAASGTAGEIRATNNITAYYSDDRLKKRLGSIENPLDKVRTLDSFYYEANETAQELGYEPIREVGISAQQVQAVLPEVVVPAPIDARYLTVRYERLVPLLIAAIKELEEKVKVLESK